MIGFFKFFLSLVIIASHSSYYSKVKDFNWFNQGISAVIPFFVLSGYFASLSYDKFKKRITSSPCVQGETPSVSPAKGLENLKSYYLLLVTCCSFFKSRFVKLALQYYLYAILTFIFIAFSQPQNLKISLFAFIANLTILPLNLHHFFKICLFTNSYYDGILPPAWYLAALFQYYLLTPFIHRFKFFKIFLWLISGSIFLLAIFNLIPNNYYSYRFLGNFIFFLTGDLIYQSTDKPRLVPKLFILYFSFLFLTLIQFSTHQIYQLNTNAPLLFGFLFFTPITYLLLKKIYICTDKPRLVPLLSAIRTNNPKINPSIIAPKNLAPSNAATIACPLLAEQSCLLQNKIDNYLSSLSFSIYLNHYLFVYIFDWLKMINVLSITNNLIKFALVTFSSVIFAIFNNLIFKFNKK